MSTNQENDISDSDPSLEQISKEKYSQSELEKHNNPIALPTMISSPSPPSDSPPHSVVDHSSSGYVFPPPETKQATYQSPPSDYIHTSHISSPDATPIRFSSPPVQSKPPDEEVVKPAGDGFNRRPRISISISERNREVAKRKILLGVRILGFLFCLISFSVMAADKNKGWALDSFNHYIEFRYCMSINVIGFVYSGVQSCDLAYCLATGKTIALNKLRILLDFSLDQILTYLALSASSTAAFRVEDWESNWGKDKFPAMARSSVVLSFFAFVTFALSSLVSGHTLFTSKFI
ncbi:CASP-like protein 4A1 [Euphorbia peplus]|nr:CASP-like protein 4A1 [Euphorbia peplus]